MGRHTLRYPGVTRPSRWRDAKRKYGVNLAAFEALLHRQGGLCAICREPLTKPYIDHCHETGQVRGLLCRWCNLGIGHLREDPRIIHAAAVYVARNRGSYVPTREAPDRD